MIDKLRIKNYQRHERLSINIDSNVLAITGPTDTGKSSILRALKWVATNRPLGMGYIRNGCDRVDVSMRVDGVSVKRSRSKDQNSYQLKVNGKRSIFEAIGTDVPEFIEKLLNLGPENFQGQHDPPFWFSLSGSDVAKALNRIVDLSAIDEVAAYLSNELRGQKKVVELFSKRKEDTEEEMKRLEFVSKLTEDYDYLTECLSKKTGLEEAVTGLDIVVERVERFEAVQNRKAKMVEESERLIGIGENVISLEKEATGLLSIIKHVEKIQLSADREVPDMTKLEKDRELAQEAGRLQSEILGLVDTIDGQLTRLTKLREKQIAAEENLMDELDGVCPICGGEFDG